MVIQSKSGTGKTLVFGVVMLEAVDLTVDTVQGLILAPTREIAFQNAHVIYTIGSELSGKISLEIYSLHSAQLLFPNFRIKCSSVYWWVAS